MPQEFLSPAESLAFLASQHLGRLATCAADGRPYITPLYYLLHDGVLYFHCAREGRKLDHLAGNDAVCFEVSRIDRQVQAPRLCAFGTRYTSVQVFGRGCVMPEGAGKTEILNLLARRFAGAREVPAVSRAEAEACAVVAIVPEEISGKRNVDSQGAP